VLVIRCGRVIDPASALDAVADLVIADGRIQAVHPEGLGVSGAEVIDAKGKIVCPGFVDLHTHLRVPGFPQKETMATGTSAAAAGGFTMVCAMANTSPVVDGVDALRQVLAEAERDARVRVRQLGAATVGLRGEELTDLSALHRVGAVAFSDDGRPVNDESIMRQALSASAALGVPISVHEEDPSLVGTGVANTGAIARRLGLPEWPCAGEASMVARDVALLEQIGGHLHIAHVSCAETVGLIRSAKQRGLNITAEVTPHHLRLTDRLLEGDPAIGLPPAHPLTKVNPPLRSHEDAEALIEALADGTIDAVATDHAPHAEADKAQPYQAAAFGFTGLETALPLTLDLIRHGSLDLVTLIERMTAGPARVFELDAGTLRLGAIADVCVFDLDSTWEVRPETLASKGKNTPLLGRRLTGRVMYTIVGGNVVHRAGT
jgi:dihydroorotase